jgi:hypothetical protein
MSSQLWTKLASIFLVSDVLAWLVRLVVIFGCWAWPAARLSRRRRGFHGPRGCSFLDRSDGSGWSAGWEGLQAGDGSGDLAAPGPVPGDPQAQPTVAAGQAAGDGEQAQPEPFRFPAADGVGQGDHLGPGQPLAGQRDDLAPQLVLGEAFSGRFRSPVSMA